MSVKSILLGCFGGVVFLLIVALFVQVRSAPAKPNPQKVQEAVLKHQRSNTAPSAANMPADPWARTPDATPATPAQPKLGLDPGVTTDTAPPPTYDPPPAQPPIADLENDPRMDVANAKDEANRMYDRQDYEGAMAKALEILAKEPGDIRMLRVVVSSACQLGDADKAKQYWSQLPPHDQNQMNRRCQRFGITFAEQ
jgi:hypothetical protein